MIEYSTQSFISLKDASLKGFTSVVHHFHFIYSGCISDCFTERKKGARFLIPTFSEHEIFSTMQEFQKNTTL